MIFGKHINRYYLKYSPMLLLGILSLLVVDVLQLKIPELYQMVIDGFAARETANDYFTAEYLIGEICMPLVIIILFMVFGRFLWRICIFGAGIKVETDLRNRMFDHAKDLSREYYQVNKVGNLMSLFTNDLETVQDCFGSGILAFFDALLLGGLAIIKMFDKEPIMALLSMIPMVFLLASSAVVGKYMSKKWDARQESFSKLSDFSQESFSGIAVIKAFVKEGLELMAFKKLNRENERTNVEFTKASVLLRILVTLFVESVVCVILGYGG